MIKRLLASLCLFGMIIPTALAEVTARVDKTEIVPGETITLTITTDTNSESPDIEPFKNLFDVVGMNSSTQTVNINGQISRSRSWIMALSPKTTTSSIVIPPLNVGNEQTKPITIKFIDTPQNLSVNGQDILKIETALEQKSVYIQQQQIFTLRVYIDAPKIYKVNQLIKPTIPDLNFQFLTEQNYEKQINGIQYEVIEQKYALSALKSGSIHIPSYALTATIRDKNSLQNKTVTSNELTLEVKPRPANYPANMPFLPAKDVTLSEQWSNPSDNLLEGDSISRTITITATGLTSKQIGTLSIASITGIRSYPENPQLHDNWSQLLPIGTVIQQHVLIPTQAGKITIPEVKIPWWNTQTNKLEYATLPAKTLDVATNPALHNSNSNKASSNTNTLPTIPNIIRKVESPYLWVWQSLSAFFAVTTFIFLGLWLYSRQQPAIIKQEQPIINPKTLLDDIKRACQENDPQQARTALDNWAKQQPENLTDIMIRYTPLAEAIEELNKVLYSEASSTWKGDKLWQAIQTLPPKEQTQSSESIIPPLYPK
ncbi:BatD family protein [Entomomonas moraniae]|nr:BatD family protein [Entomomonas moraniae]